MGLNDRDYMRGVNRPSRPKSSPPPSDSEAYKRSSGPDLSKLRFNSATGELEIPEVSSKAGVYRRPIVEINGRERVKRQKLERLKSALDSKKSSPIQRPLPAWVYFVFVVVVLSFLVSVVNDFVR
jgi:hypothetical protein